jgi:hypothetical protein
VKLTDCSRLDCQSPFDASITFGCVPPENEPKIIVGGVRNFFVLEVGMSDVLSEQVLLGAACCGDAIALEGLILSLSLALERYIGLWVQAVARRHVGTAGILHALVCQMFRDVAKFNSAANGFIFAWLKGIADHRLSSALKQIRRKKRSGTGGIQGLIHRGKNKLPKVPGICPNG